MPARPQHPCRGTPDSSRMTTACRGALFPATTDRNRTGESAASGDVPPVCQHCGASERPGEPVETFEVGGVRSRLHPACQADWTTGPDPEDCPCPECRAGDPFI